MATELADARAAGREGLVEEIHGRFSCRIHNLSEFMKTLLQRFMRWFNHTHQRSGTLWEGRYKSVIAARTVANTDLNPVRAGMVVDPAEYRWSCYGEAAGGGHSIGSRQSIRMRIRCSLARCSMAWVSLRSLGLPSSQRLISSGMEIVLKRCAVDILGFFEELGDLRAGEFDLLHGVAMALDAVFAGMGGEDFGAVDARQAKSSAATSIHHEMDHVVRRYPVAQVRRQEPRGAWSMLTNRTDMRWIRRVAGNNSARLLKSDRRLD